MNNLFNFKASINQYIANQQIIDDPLLCYAYGTDASVYRMTPKLVIFIKNFNEVQYVITQATKYNIPITFRAAGTSLSGQAVTDSVLVVLSPDSWNNYAITDNGEQIKLESGLIAGKANLFLKPFGKKIGPDPASINSCKIGGVVANNSSGMCCGVKYNTYNTIKHIKAILPNGFVFDTTNPDCQAELTQKYPEFIQQLNNIKHKITSDVNLVNCIRDKFSIKNTTGYSLNAFLDYNNPIDIIMHLLVGSEGTLGFIGEVTYNTIDDYKYKQVGLIYLDNLDRLANLVVELSSYNINAIELLDISSLNAVSKLSTTNKYLPRNLTENVAAILVELTNNNQELLLQEITIINSIINQHNVYYKIDFTDNPTIINELWDLRKGIIPIIGANRASETSLIVEDVAVTMHKLPQLVEDLKQLFSNYAYSEAAIFGHVLAGNLHIVFAQNLTKPAEIEKYDNFMYELSVLVAQKHGGSLKAEHGSGRNMAPFVELEWGHELYTIMWELKNLFDPQNIFNPNVILSHNKLIHIQNLKDMHKIDDIVDKCIECGFCESICPSKNLSFTPRQRIVAYRYIQKLKTQNNILFQKLEETYNYYGIKTCATTGLCELNCPVHINTGNLILKLKYKPNNFFIKLIANNYGRFINLNKYIVKFINKLNKLGNRNMVTKVTRKMHKVFDVIPVYMPTTKNMVTINEVTINKNTQQEKILYIPSCSSRIFNTNDFAILCNNFGFDVIKPNKFNNLCCGQFFNSQGDVYLEEQKQHELLKNIDFSNYKYVVIDNTSCHQTLINSPLLVNYLNANKIISEVEFIWQYITTSKPALDKKFNKVALHVDCSSKKVGLHNKIMDILTYCSDEIIIPHDITCCGFAGSKGFTVPELNQSALNTLNTQINDCECGVTFNPNCGVGLSYYGKIQYYTLSQLINICLYSK